MALPKKILVVGGFDRSLINFRGALLRDMVAAGHQVVAASPLENSEVPETLAAAGVRFCAIDLTRTGTNPLADLRARRNMEAVIRRERPDVVLAYTIKPIVHGIPAARQAGVARCHALITGLGAAFHTPGIRGWVVKRFAIELYRRALRQSDSVIVQNVDIEEFLQRRKIIATSRRCVVVPGSGVDTDHFSIQPQISGPPIFLVLARMLRDKGIFEFVEAAEEVRMRLPSARFRLVGDIDPNPAAISAQTLLRWQEAGIVEYQPGVRDVRPFLRDCSIYVLPSYHEGMPRSVLEAMATGRPIITTDTIGCRETVARAGVPDTDGIRTGENGLLVPVRSVRPLAAAMLRLATSPATVEAMGRAGRLLAERRFDVRGINRLMLQALQLTSSME